MINGPGPGQNYGEMAVNGRFVVTLVNFRVDMVREWNVPQRSFSIEKKFGGADLAQIVIRNEYMILKTALKNLMESWVGPVYLVIFSVTRRSRSDSR